MQFLVAGDFAEGLAHVNAGGGGGVDGEGSLCGPPRNYGYIDKTGAFVIEPQFTEARPFAGGLAQVATAEGKRRLIDRSGKVVWLL